MLCQQCQKRVANVHYTHIINGQKAEMYLCEQCANEKGKYGFSPNINLGEFLWGIQGLGGNSGFSKKTPQEEVRCDVCGMSFKDFRKTGRLGCGNCYNTFRDSLSPILRRIHGSNEHKGKVPGTELRATNAMGELEKLKAELKAAIGKEEYEKAAELRDRIKEMEKSPQ